LELEDIATLERHDLELKPVASSVSEEALKLFCRYQNHTAFVEVSWHGK
jgi:hypothetical protein